MLYLCRHGFGVGDGGVVICGGGGNVVGFDVGDVGVVRCWCFLVLLGVM